MMDEQLIPLRKDEINKDMVDKQVNNNDQVNKLNDIKKDVINKLPEWSIEPPVEINRGIE